MTCEICGTGGVTCLFHITEEIPHIPARVIKSVVLTVKGDLRLLPGTRKYTPRDAAHEVLEWLKDEDNCVESEWHLSEIEMVAALEGAQLQYLKKTSLIRSESSTLNAIQDLNKLICSIKCPFCGASSIGHHTRSCSWSKLVFTAIQEKDAKSYHTFDEVLAHEEFKARRAWAQPVGDPYWNEVFLSVNIMGEFTAEPDKKKFPLTISNIQGLWCLIPAKKCV